MKVAVSAANPDLDAVIQLRFENSRGILIVETDTMEITSFVTENSADAILSNDCEMLLCGEIHDAVFFDKIAGYGVTRCLAAGLSVREAIEKGLRNELPLLRDYVGGTGCHSEGHGDGCCHHHDHEDVAQ